MNYEQYAVAGLADTLWPLSAPLLRKSAATNIDHPSRRHDPTNHCNNEKEAATGDGGLEVRQGLRSGGTGTLVAYAE